MLTMTQKQLKQERQQEIEDRLKARKDAAEDTRRDGAVKKTAVQIVDEAIDSVVNCLDATFASKKRILHSRPSNREIIADEANIYGNYSTIRTYQEVFSVIAYTIYNIHTARTLDLISRTHHAMFTSILLFAPSQLPRSCFTP